MSKNSFKAKTTLEVAGKSYEVFDITSFKEAVDLPFSLKVLLENLLRTEDGANITAEQIKKLAIIPFFKLPIFSCMPIKLAGLKVNALNALLSDKPYLIAFRTFFKKTDLSFKSAVVMQN